MQRIGSIEDVDERTALFFKEVVCKDPDLFDEDMRLATMQTCMQLIETEDIGEPPLEIKLNGKTYKRHSDLLDMKFRYLVELVNLDVDYDTMRFFHMVGACFYLDDLDDPFDKNKYFDRARNFHSSMLIFSLFSVRLFNDLIVSLQETYPTLYEGNTQEKSGGRKLYDMLNALSGDNPTKQKEAEELPLWRCFSWMEQKKIDAINAKNGTNY